MIKNNRTRKWQGRVSETITDNFFLDFQSGCAMMARRERSTHEKTMDIIDRFIDWFYNNGTGGRYVK